MKESDVKNMATGYACVVVTDPFCGDGLDQKRVDDLKKRKKEVQELLFRRKSS